MPLPVTIHQLQLTPAQLALARKIATSRAAPHREVVRAKLTLLIVDAPAISHAQAARYCGLHPHSVYQLRRRWAEHGWSLQDAPRSGRPRVFSPTGHHVGESPGL